MRVLVSKDTPELRSKFRAVRDKWLQITDSYMLPDRGLSEEQYDVLIMYRQALRDAPVDGLPATSWTLPEKPPFILETVIP